MFFMFLVLLLFMIWKVSDTKCVLKLYLVSHYGEDTACLHGQFARFGRPCPEAQHLDVAGVRRLEFDNVILLVEGGPVDDVVELNVLVANPLLGRHRQDIVTTHHL